jgi:hypothetical protein
LVMVCGRILREREREREREWPLNWVLATGSVRTEEPEGVSQLGRWGGFLRSAPNFLGEKTQNRNLNVENGGLGVGGWVGGWVRD